MAIRYSPDTIQQLSAGFSAELEADIVERLSEIKRQSQQTTPVVGGGSGTVSKRKQPVQLKYYVLSQCKSSHGDIMYQNILLNLNKLTPKNYSSIEQDMKSILDKYIEQLDKRRLAQELFAKGIQDIQFSDLYCQLIDTCSQHIQTMKRACEDTDPPLMDLILEQCDAFYDSSVRTDIQLVQSSMSYDDLCKLFKEKSKVLGGFMFIATLYTKGMVSESLVQSYYKGLLEYIQSAPPEYAEYFIDAVCKFVKGIAPKYSQFDRLTFQRNIVEPLSSILQKNTSLKPKQRFAIMDVIEYNETLMTATANVSKQDWKVVSRGKK